MLDPENIHRLNQQLAEYDETSGEDGHQKIDLLNGLAWALFDIDNQRARELSETAFRLAGPTEDGKPTYEAGQAYSLRTLGYLNMRSGDYATSLAQHLKAQQIFESMNLEDGLLDVFGGITSIYFFFGDYPLALDMAYKRMDAARQIGDKRRIADANNSLANINFEIGDYGRALGFLTDNLKFARELKYDRLECATLVKLEQAYFATGDYPLALENGCKGIQKSRELGYKVYEARALSHLGQCYLAMNDEKRGMSYLEDALELSRDLDSKQTETLILLTMGAAYKDLGQLEQAEEVLHRAVEIVQSIGAKNNLSQGHLLLSEVYQKQGDHAQALDHFKQYYAINELINGEKSKQRMKLLEVLHNVETIKNEAEIAHLRTVELQNNISEKERAQQQLQRQLSYARALSACSQTLLSPVEGEDDFQNLLARALQHLIEPSRASSIYLLENIDDPKLGFSSNVVCRTYASDSLIESEDQESLPKYRERFLQLPDNSLSGPFDSRADVIPWSLFPAEIPQLLANGVPVSRSIKELQEANPLWGEFLSKVVQIQNIQLFPIIINNHWWGTLSLDDRIDRGQWDEDELLLLRAATEIIKNTLQRRQAQVELSSLNNQLEQKVEARTIELRNTIKKLSKEVGERERAENSLQEMMGSLEQHLIARTNELATFFDLILMAGQGVDLSEIFEYVVPRMMEFTESQSVVIDLFEEDGDAMNMIAQGNLPEEAPARIYVSEFPPELWRWIQKPNDPLLVVDLAKEIPSFETSFNLKDFPYQTYLGAQIRIGDRIDGILSCFRIEKGGYGVDVVALVTAVAQQLGLILEIDRLRQQASNMAVLEERERLARDLHDSVTQSLYSLSLFSRAGREAAEDGDTDRLKVSLTELEANILQVLREMRLLLYELRPATLNEVGLVQALESRFNTVERRTGITLDIRMDEFTDLSSSAEVELYNVIIETLNNIIKHANATHVTLELVHAKDGIFVRVIDDGRGFDPSQNNGGMGLTNIKERIARLNGQISISSEPGYGTRVEALVPNRREAEG